MAIEPNSVMIYDPSDEKIGEMLDYCWENKLTLSKYEVDGVCDLSAWWDTLAIFVFKDEHDVTVFKLKYR